MNLRERSASFCLRRELQNKESRESLRQNIVKYKVGGNCQLKQHYFCFSDIFPQFTISNYGYISAEHPALQLRLHVNVWNQLSSVPQQSWRHAHTEGVHFSFDFFFFFLFVILWWKSAHSFALPTCYHGPNLVETAAVLSKVSTPYWWPCKTAWHRSYKSAAYCATEKLISDYSQGKTLLWNQCFLSGSAKIQFQWVKHKRDSEALIT